MRENDKTLSKHHTFSEGNWVRSAKMLYSRISTLLLSFCIAPVLRFPWLADGPHIRQTHHSSGVKP
jgi:hypothetical protein